MLSVNSWPPQQQGKSGSAMAAPIILNSSTAQYQGRSIHDSSIDDNTAGGPGATKQYAPLPPLLSKWIWSL